MTHSKPPTISDLRPEPGRDILQSGNPADRLILNHIRAGHEPADQKILLGIGAVLATCFTVAMISAFLSLISLTGGFSFVMIGVILLTMALFRDRQKSADPATKPGTVNRLLGPVLYLTGGVYLVTGLAMMADRVWVVPLAMAMLTALTVFLFRNRIRAALCLTLTLVTVPLIYSPLANGPVPAAWAPLTNNACFALLVAAAAFLVYRSRSLVHLTLELRALVMALSLLMLAFLIRNPFIRVTDMLGPFGQYWIGGAIALGTIALLYAVSRDFPTRGHEVLWAGTIGAIALAALGAPGILLAVSILALGYHRADRFITGLGAVQIPVFLFLYYYDLQATLLQKSGLLVLGGLILLAGYGWILYRMRGQSS